MSFLLLREWWILLHNYYAVNDERVNLYQPLVNQDNLVLLNELG